jgi:hypothetical protein
MDAALLDAAAITGQPYQSGDFGFVSTEMFLSVNHEVAPAEMAYGYDSGCGGCHFDGKIDWAALGYIVDDPATEDPDPLVDGYRPVP